MLLKYVIKHHAASTSDVFQTIKLHIKLHGMNGHRPRVVQALLQASIGNTSFISGLSWLSRDLAITNADRHTLHAWPSIVHELP